jgi:TRAP-type mannitol/chloroaromatic compound transport system substrate-binding protein
MIDSPEEPKCAATAHGFTALPQGTRLDGRYTIESVIAAGGFGITYLGRHDALAKECAIKEHFPRQFAYRDGTASDVRPTDPETYSWALDRFLQEGRSLVRCEHPNVVRVTDIFEANGTAYMVLSYETGQSLKAWLDKLDRAPSQSELDTLLTPLLDALAYVHAQGLLHRDIAPDNILLRHDGSPCLIDFGAARQAVAQRSQLMSAIVKTGYSPPEQYTSSGRAQGPWTDIYALGATLYRALTGQAPPEATDRLIDDELRPVVELIADPTRYRAGFLAAVDDALHLRQSERPQTVADWAAKLLGGAAPAFDHGAPAAPDRDAGASASPAAAHEPPATKEKIQSESLAGGDSPGGAVTFRRVPISTQPKAVRSWAPVAIVVVLAAFVLGAGALWQTHGRPGFSELLPGRQAAQPKAKDPASPPARPASEPGTFDSAQGRSPPGDNADELLWSSIQKSRSAADFEDYLKRFPKGIYAPLAQQRLAMLRAKERSPGPSTLPPNRTQPTPSEPLSGARWYADFKRWLSGNGPFIEEPNGRISGEISKPRRLRIQSAFPLTLQLLGSTGQDLRNELLRISDGKIELNIHAPGTLIPPFEQVDASAKGTVDGAWTSASDSIGKDTAFAVLAGSMAFGLRPDQLALWLKQEARTFYDELYGNLGVKAMPCMMQGPEGGGWFRKPINTPDDWKGLRMRFFGLGARVMQKVGVSTQLLRAAEIYPALERGVIDATEFSAPYLDLTLGFHKVAKHYYYPAWHQPAATVDLVIGMSVWRLLSSAERSAIETACAAMLARTANGIRQRQRDGLSALAAVGVKPLDFPAAVLDSLESAAWQVHEEEAAKSPAFRRVYNSYISYRQ